MRPQLLAELAVAIALAAVLSLLRVTLPYLVYGGSVSLHTLPIFLLALRHGVRPGVLAGTAYGVVNFMLSPYVVHPAQLLLDYPLAFGTLGAAGVAARRGPPGPTLATVAVVGASALRLAAHVTSGIVYFGYLAPAGTPAWKYSLVYNASYMVPETAVVAIAVAFLVRRLGRLTNPSTVSRRDPPELGR